MEYRSTRDYFGAQNLTPDAADRDGPTMISWVAGGWYGDVVEILLEREYVTPNTVNTDGRTPLSWATRMGYRSIVEVILEWKDLTPDIAGKDGRTSSPWAAGNGYEEIVNLLLEREGQPSTLWIETVERLSHGQPKWSIGAL